MRLFRAGRLVPGLLVIALVSAPAPAVQPNEIRTFRQARNRLLEQNPRLEYDPTSVLVKFKDQAAESSREAARQRVGGKRLRRFSHLGDFEHIQVADADAAMNTLRQDPAVESVSLDGVVRPLLLPDDPNWGSMWWLNNNNSPQADINAPQAWDVTTGHQEFVIAVIDTGFQMNHPDLAGNIWTNPDEIPGNGIDDDDNGYIDDMNGWDFYDDDNDPTDVFIGHGTHVAGIIGGRGNNGIGIVGVNWRCRLVPFRFLGPQGGFSSDSALALDYCVAKNIRLSNNSYGGGIYNPTVYEAIANAATNIGHVFIAAAGNGGEDGIGDDNDLVPVYPASYGLPNIIAVAATNSGNNLPGFSNYGATTVHLAAPGVGLLSTDLNSAYKNRNGTSVAAPLVTGVAALIYSRHPEWSHAQVRSRILNTVHPVPSLNGRVITGGLLNAGAALDGIGCGGPDGDGDGVPEACDNCPGVFNPSQSDANGNGQGDACDDIEPPTLLAIVSRKTHSGGIQFDLPVYSQEAGWSGVECRAGVEKLILTFSEPVEAVDGGWDDLEVTASAGYVFAVSGDGAEVTVELFDVPDRSCLTLTFTGIADLAGNPLSLLGPIGFGALHGDVNGDGQVDAADILRVKAHTGQLADGDTFQFDLDGDAAIGGFDVPLVKMLSGHNLSDACP